MIRTLPQGDQELHTDLSEGKSEVCGHLRNCSPGGKSSTGYGEDTGNYVECLGNTKEARWRSLRERKW